MSLFLPYPVPSLSVTWYLSHDIACYSTNHSFSKGALAGSSIGFAIMHAGWRGCAGLLWSHVNKQRDCAMSVAGHVSLCEATGDGQCYIRLCFWGANQTGWLVHWTWRSSDVFQVFQSRKRWQRGLCGGYGAVLRGLFKRSVKYWHVPVSRNVSGVAVPCWRNQNVWDSSMCVLLNYSCPCFGTMTFPGTGVNEVPDHHLWRLSSTGWGPQVDRMTTWSFLKVVESTRSRLYILCHWKYRLSWLFSSHWLGICLDSTTLLDVILGVDKSKYLQQGDIQSDIFYEPPEMRRFPVPY